MVVVNVIVINSLTKKTLLPWNICDVTENEHSFTEFFNYTILPQMPSTLEVSYELVSAEVGPSKESLDKVDLKLPVISVIETFGRFLKYYVKDKTTIVHAPHANHGVNAFQILMDAQRQLQHGKKFPDRIAERIKKINFIMIYCNFLHQGTRALRQVKLTLLVKD